VITCEQCLNNLGNGNLAGIKSVLSQWLLEQQLDPDGNIDLLQQRICSNCQSAS